MKKINLLLLLFFVFSCKSAPKVNIADDPGLSQLELTAEDENGADAEFSDEPSADESSVDEPSANETPADESLADGSSADEPSSGGLSANENTLAPDGATDVSEISGNPEIKTDDLQADARTEEKKSAVETVEDKKPSAPSAVQPPPVVTKEVPPPAPAAPVNPQPVATKEDPSPAADASPEQPAEDKQDAGQSESGAPQTTPRRQPWITPPPAVSAVKDDAPVSSRQETVPQKEENVFSRIVNATVGQFVEIPFRGTNWSYLEDIVSRRGIVYDSRRNDSEGMVFTFRAEEAGSYVLRFYRRDYIRDYILYDYVQVIVGAPPDKNGGAGWFNPPVDRGKVTAEPRWPSAIDEAAMLRGGARPASGASVESAPTQSRAAAAQADDRQPAPAQARGATVPPQTASENREPAQTRTAPADRDTPSAQANGAGTAPQIVTPPVTAPETQAEAKTPVVEKQEKLPPEEILKKAQDAFKGGKTDEAIALLDQYAEYYQGGDELYWLYGQYYEANTPSRNILLSLDYYRRLVNEYPQSRYYNDARRRTAYLERFYINIQ